MQSHARWPSDLVYERTKQCGGMHSRRLRFVISLVSGSVLASDERGSVGAGRRRSGSAAPPLPMMQKWKQRVAAHSEAEGGQRVSGVHGRRIFSQRRERQEEPPEAQDATVCKTCVEHASHVLNFMRVLGEVLSVLFLRVRAQNLIYTFPSRIQTITSVSYATSAGLRV